MSTLYELTGQMAAIEAALEETGGELTPELEELWAETAESLQAKVDNYHALVIKLEDHSGNVAKRIKELQDLKKLDDNSVKRIKGHILNVMNENGLTKLEGAYCKVSLSSSTSTEVDEELLLQPYRYKVDNLGLPDWIEVELKVKKSVLKDRFKDAEVTPAGVSFVKNQTIRFK